MGYHAHQGVRLILSTHSTMSTTTEYRSLILLSFHGSPHIQPLPRIPPLPPFHTLILTEEKLRLPLMKKTPTVRSLQAPGSFTLFSGFPTFLPADAPIQNLSAFPKPRRIPAHYANNETMALACRAASHDFRHYEYCAPLMRLNL